MPPDSGRSRGRPLDYGRAGELLVQIFNRAEAEFTARKPSSVASELASALDTLFSSRTKSYREALLGCALVRLLDRVFQHSASLC